MPKKGEVHVVPSEDGWRVEIEGTGRAHSTHTTQAEAARAARRIARQSKAKLLIHGRNGKIRDRQELEQARNENVPHADALVSHGDELYSKYIDGCGRVSVRRDKAARWRVDWEPDDRQERPFSLRPTDVALPLDFPVRGAEPAELLWWAERYFAAWCGHHLAPPLHVT